MKKPANHNPQHHFVDKVDYWVRQIRSGAAALLLAFILFLSLFPFIFMVLTSLKSISQYYGNFWVPTFPFHWENYLQAIDSVGPYLINSIIVTGVSVFGILVNSLIMGFLFARYHFPGKNLLYISFMGMLMIPGVLLLVPSFIWVKKLGLLDTYWVMILPYVAGGQVMGVYLMRSFIADLSEDLFSAAHMDGAGVLAQIWYIALPMSKPVLSIITIMSTLSVWNNFLWPLVTTRSEEVIVVTVGMLRFSNEIGIDLGRLFAGYVISAIPLAILFAIATRPFLKGISSGAVANS